MTVRMNMIMQVFSLSAALSISWVVYRVEACLRAIEKSLKELYIRKNTSSLVSLKLVIARLLTVKIVEDIWRIDSVREN